MKKFARVNYALSLFAAIVCALSLMVDATEGQFVIHPKNLAAACGSLCTDLEHAWFLDEQSGTRADEVGSADLTDNNTVTAKNRGPLGTVAREVAANDEYLSTTGVDLRGLSKASWSFWFRATTVAANQTLSADSDFGALPSEGTHLIRLTATGTFSVYLLTSNGDTGTGCEMRYNAVTIAAGEWHHVSIVFDGTLSGDANRLKLYLDGVSQAQSVAAGAVPATLGNFGITNGLLIGRWPGTGQSFDGDLSRFGIWSGQALSADDALSFFNSGNGKSYDDLTTAEKVGLVSYWDMDEVSGTRADSHGSNDLTDNNTVGSVHSGPAGTVAAMSNAAGSYLGTALQVDSFDGTGDFTLVGWLRGGATVTRVLGTTVSNGAGNIGVQIIMAATTYANVYDSVAGVSQPEISDGNPNPTGWNFVALTYNATTKVPSISKNGSTLTAGAALANGLRDAQYVHAMGLESGSYDGNAARVGVWERVLTQGEIVSIFNSGSGKKRTDLTTDEKVSLVHYWEMDETSGNRLGYNAAGVETIPMTPRYSPTSVINAGGAMDGAAASFVAGNNEYLSRTAAVLPATGSYSVSGWFNVPSPSAARTLLSEYGPNAGGYPINFLLRESLRMHLGDGTPNNYTSPIDPSTAPPTAKWFHVIFTLDRVGDEAKLYLNNSVVTTVTPLPYASQTATVPFYIGSTASVEPGTFVGDEVAVWSRVLTSDEITELYNAGAGKFYDGTEFAYLFFDQPFRYAQNRRQDYFFFRPYKPPLGLRALKKAS